MLSQPLLRKITNSKPLISPPSIMKGCRLKTSKLVNLVLVPVHECESWFVTGTQVFCAFAIPHAGATSYSYLVYTWYQVYCVLRVVLV